MTRRAPLIWRVATVARSQPETPSATTLILDVPDWPGHLAGQHVDVRLTAEDGYQAQRSYAIASAPEDDHVVLTVERLDDGEVSPYLVDELRPGDQLELRGPLGGYFVWEASLGGPLLLLAGGSGVVPLRAARALDDVINRDELMANVFGDSVDIRFTLTREQPEGWRGWERWTDMELLQGVTWPQRERPLVYVCGPTPFVEKATISLIALGHEPGRVLHEAFGPTGV